MDLGDSIDQVLLATPFIAKWTSSHRRRPRDGHRRLQVPRLTTSPLSAHWCFAFIAIEDLLGRDEVPTDSQLFKGIRDAVVCVTGAGGRLALSFADKSSVAGAVNSDRSEPALYAITRTRTHHWWSGATASPRFCHRFRRAPCLFKDQAVKLVFHAAAYKHVPLVEANRWPALPTMCVQLLKSVVLH